MKKKVYFAIAHKSVEDYIEEQLADEIEVIGSAVYRESVVQAIKKEEPDILVIRETLPGNIDFLEIIDAVRVESQKHVQIIVMTGGRQPGDEFLSALVRYSVFDLVIGDSINIKEVCNLIRKPNVWKDVSMYAPKVKIDEKTKKQIFEAPNIPKVVEKEVIREIIVDQTNVTDAETSARTVKELEKIEQKKMEIESEQKRIQAEKEKIDREKEQLSLEKEKIQKEYEERQLEFEKSMELRVKAIEDEKERLILIEKEKIKKELESGMREIQRLKLEAEKTIDEEKRKIHENKQFEMEKNIEILRLENEQRIKVLEQEADKKVQLEQEKYTQMQIDEIEKFKLEKAQLEDKYLALKRKEEIDKIKRDKESQAMQKEIDALKEKQSLLQKQREEDLRELENARIQLEEEKKKKDIAENEAKLELKRLESALKEKEEELEQEKEILAVKYTSLENSLFSEFNKKKQEIEENSKKKLELSRVALKNDMQKYLDAEKRKILSDTVTPRGELERAFVLKQKQISESYKKKLQDLIDSIKSETAESLANLEKELLQKREEEEGKLSTEKLELDKEKESLSREMQEFLKNKESMIKSIEEEKQRLEVQHKEFEDKLNAEIAKKEEYLESERLILKNKEAELDEKMRAFEEEQKRIVNEKLQAIKAQDDEKERELEEQKMKLLRDQENFENSRLESERKAEQEAEYIKNQLKKLEEEKELLLKMKSEATSMNLRSSSSMSRNVLTFLGCKSGVGTTTVAFNTAVSLASSGHKVLYLELNKEFSGVSYAYKLGFYDAGIDFAMSQMQESNYEFISKNIISLKDIQENTSNDDLMYHNYKKMPESLEYLFFSGKYYGGDKVYCEKSFKDLMMFILMKLNYDYVIFDVNMSTKVANSENDSIVDEITDSILKFSSKVYFVITQDITAVGGCLQVRKLMKKSSIPVNEFRFVLNRYDSKAKLTKKGLEDWLKVKIDLVLPDKHRELVDSNYIGLPLVLYTKDKEVTKFYKSMESDILGVRAGEKQKKGRKR